MMLTAEDNRKLELLDIFLGSVSTERLKEIVEQEQVVSKLRDDQSSFYVLRQLINDATHFQTELLNARAELQSLKSDMATLVKCLNSSIYGYNQDFQNLKQKHNVY